MISHFFIRMASMARVRFAEQAKCLMHCPASLLHSCVYMCIRWQTRPLRVDGFRPQHTRTETIVFVSLASRKTSLN